MNEQIYNKLQEHTEYVKYAYTIMVLRDILSRLKPTDDMVTVFYEIQSKCLELRELMLDKQKV